MWSLSGLVPSVKCMIGLGSGSNVVRGKPGGGPGGPRRHCPTMPKFGSFPEADTVNRTLCRLVEGGFPNSVRCAGQPRRWGRQLHDESHHGFKRGGCITLAVDRVLRTATNTRCLPQITRQRALGRLESDPPFILCQITAMIAHVVSPRPAISIRLFNDGFLSTRQLV
jgi:hypothetical protein